MQQFPYPTIEPMLYFSDGSSALFDYFSEPFIEGNTGSLSGFYGPQGREVRLNALDADFLDKLHLCGLDNFEMETSAIYALSTLLGHEALSLNCIIANRTTGRFLSDYKTHVDEMIQKALEMASDESFRKLLA